MKTLMYSMIGILGLLVIAAVIYAIDRTGHFKQIIFILGGLVVIHALVIWNKADLGNKPKDKK